MFSMGMDNGRRRGVDNWRLVVLLVAKGGVMSWTVTCAEAQENLAAIMDRICDQHKSVIITHQSLPAVVLMSLEDYEAIMETAHLLSSPANASRLREALQAADTGTAVQDSRESQLGC